MDNVFDRAASLAFGSAANLMGYDASWTPKAGGETKTARVLFRAPTAKELHAGREWDETQYQMEYREGDFPGLELTTGYGYDNTEVVTIANVKYQVLQVTRKWDGRTYKAKLAPADDRIPQY